MSNETDQAMMFLEAMKDRIGHLKADLAISQDVYDKGIAILDALRELGKQKVASTSNGPYNPSQMLDAIGVTGKAKKDILAGKDPSKKKKRKYTKRANYWKNPVKKHAKV